MKTATQPWGGAGGGTSITQDDGSIGMISSDQTAYVFYFAGRPVAQLTTGASGSAGATIWSGGFTPFGAAENIPKAIGQAGNFPGSPKCQAILQKHGVWPCVCGRFGPAEIGQGPLIKCQGNPPGTDACGETTPQFACIPTTIHLYTGSPNCPRSKPGFGI